MIVELQRGTERPIFQSKSLSISDAWTLLVISAPPRRRTADIALTTPPPLPSRPICRRAHAVIGYASIPRLLY